MTAAGEPDRCTFNAAGDWNHDCDCRLCEQYNAAMDSYWYPEH